MKEDITCIYEYSTFRDCIAPG